MRKRKDHKEQAHCIQPDQVVADYIGSLAKYMHPTILEYISRPENEVPDILMGPNYKSMLNEWVSREEVPKPTDVEIIHQQISKMIRSDKLNHMYDVMKYLCRYLPNLMLMYSFP